MPVKPGNKYKFLPRVCSLCGQEYVPTSATQKVCKPCQPEYDRLWNKEYNVRTRDQITVKKRERSWKQSLQTHVFSNLKFRLHAPKYKGIPFNVTQEDIHVPEFCPVLGLPLKRNKGKPKGDSPSVDRIIPELGYTKGNIQIISYKANKMKNDASIEELIKFANWIKREYDNDYYKKETDKDCTYTEEAHY